MKHCPYGVKVHYNTCQVCVRLLNLIEEKHKFKKNAQMQQHIVKIIYNGILCVTLIKRNIKRICAELSFVNVWRGFTSTH